MFLLYVDESGDPGIVNSPTQYYILTGIVLNELRWRDYLDELITFRKNILKLYGLHLREEIHASQFINNPKNVVRIKRYDRLAIIREFANQLSGMVDLNVINVVVDKANKPNNYDVATAAWKALLQRFENTISFHNFHGPNFNDDRGMIITDNTYNKKLVALVRQMRVYNPVPNKNGIGYRNLRLTYTIEDPNFRDSIDSYFIQGADLIAYLLLQNIQPCMYMKKKSGNNYFSRLDPILCKAASSANPQGIVTL